MEWCEQNGVDFLFGLAKNERLTARSRPNSPPPPAEPSNRPAGAPLQGLHLVDARQLEPARRVVAKAEWTGGEANPRFVVTSLARDEHEARHLYEKLYCARGEMENRIKECQLDLFADRTSAHTMRANQLRLWFASMAYVLICALRRIGLAHTQFAEATCGTIRLKLLKIGALVRISVRRIKLAMASAFPYQDEFALAHCASPPRRADPETAPAIYHPVRARPHCARHDSLKLRAGALATMPCTARTIAPIRTGMRNPGLIPT